MNLGEVLMGEKIYNSTFQIYMNQTERCKVLCTKVLSAADVANFKGLIEDEYIVNWIVDNLPVTTRYTSSLGSQTYMNGFPVGFVSNGNVYIHNHYSITIYYHSVDAKPFDTDFSDDDFRIVGFEV